MWLLIVEALIALALLVGMVWWVMFSGRRRGERGQRHEPGEPHADRTDAAAEDGEPPGSGGAR